MVRDGGGRFPVLPLLEPVRDGVSGVDGGQRQQAARAEPRRELCDPLASNGVTVVKKTSGRWRFITAGSSFTCGELYDKVPKLIAKDLRIKCITAT